MNGINVIGGPAEPLPPNAGYEPLTAAQAFAANGISAASVQPTDVTALALVSMNAFTVVKVGSGGIAPVDPTVPGDQDAIFGVTLSSVIAGANVGVRLMGVLQNNLPGMTGWNWTIGAPLFVGPAGVIQATRNTSGWNVQIGRAISAVGVDLAIPQRAYGKPAVPLAYTADNTTNTVDASAVDAVDITLAAAGSTLALTNGYDGQTIKLAVVQDATGSRLLTITGAILPNGFAWTATPSKTDLVELRYVAAKSAWALRVYAQNI